MGAKGQGKAKRYFTITEMLVVLVIVMIITAIGAGAYHVAMKKAAQNTTVANLNKIRVALEAFKGRYGFYPQQSPVGDFGYALNNSIYDGADFKLKSLLNLKSEKTSGNAQEDSGTYYMIDGWKNRIQYQCPGTTNTQGFDLYSKGEDNAAGTNDDIWCEGIKTP